MIPMGHGFLHFWLCQESYPMTDTIINAVTQTVRPTINVRRFFQNMGQSFQSSYSFLGELMQNARRAGSTEVRFLASYEGRALEVIDNGCGIENFQDLIELCTSGWKEEDIQLSERPFGMGLFSLFYACAHITIRSRGQVLAISLDDVVNERALHVRHDDVPVEQGTRILMTGLNDALLPKEWKEGQEWKLITQLRAYAEGFEIPVLLNDVVLPQPCARRNIAGQITAVGWIFIDGVHTKSGTVSLGSHDTSYFLQGLPIESTGGRRGRNIVHLDSERFIPVMPDRARLQDSGAQLAKVHETAVGLVKDFLVTQKERLDPQTFLSQYFYLLRQLNVMYLINDIGLLPVEALRRVNEVSNRMDATSEALYSRDYAFVSRQGILSGEIKVWRHAPTSTEYSQWAAALLKVMQNEDILAAQTDELDHGHWIFDAAPDVHDFDVTVDPRNVQGSISVDCGDWSSCEMTLVDSVVITVTSRSDSDFKIEHELVDDWVVVPAEPVVDPDDDGDFQGDAICYFTAVDRSNDHPCEAFQSFTDEWGVVQDDWVADARANWDSLANGLRGQPMARTLVSALEDVSHAITPNQVNDMAAVRAVRNWNCFDPEMQRTKHHFDVVDLSRLEFWESVAKQINGTDGSIEAKRLMDAFKAVLKPDELMLHAGEALELITGAGYSMRGTGDKTFVLNPGEQRPDHDPAHCNYQGMFASEDVARDEVSKLVIRDTLAFHKIEQTEFDGLEFPAKWKLVRAAHEDRMADAKARREAQTAE